MQIKNDAIQESLCLHNKQILFNQLKEIDRITSKEEVSALVDNNRKCLIINRCVHPNLFIVNYVIQGSSEKEMVITERELYES